MIESHLFIFAFQNYIYITTPYIYISQRRATGGTWSITTVTALDAYPPGQSLDSPVLKILKLQKKN